MIHLLGYFSRPSLPSKVCTGRQWASASELPWLNPGKAAEHNAKQESRVCPNNKAQMIVVKLPPDEEPVAHPWHRQRPIKEGTQDVSWHASIEERALSRRACLALAHTAIWYAPAVMNRNAVSVRVAKANITQPRISNV